MTYLTRCRRAALQRLRTVRPTVADRQLQNLKRLMQIGRSSSKSPPVKPDFALLRAECRHQLRWTTQLPPAVCSLEHSVSAASLAVPTDHESRADHQPQKPPRLSTSPYARTCLAAPAT